MKKPTTTFILIIILINCAYSQPPVRFTQKIYKIIKSYKKPPIAKYYNKSIYKPYTYNYTDPKITYFWDEIEVNLIFYGGSFYEGDAPNYPNYNEKYNSYLNVLSNQKHLCLCIP